MALVGAGADVTLAVRNPDAGDRTAADITTTTGNDAVHVGRLDLADQRSVGAEAGNARIFSLSSRGHLRSPVVFDDLNFASCPYDPMDAYGQSKTAIVLFAVEATHRWGDDGITANAVHPGAIEATNPVPLHGPRGPLGASRLWNVQVQDGPARSRHQCPVLVAAHALDPATAELVWDVSLQAIG